MNLRWKSIVFKYSELLGNILVSAIEIIMHHSWRPIKYLEWSIHLTTCNNEIKVRHNQHMMRQLVDLLHKLYLRSIMNYVVYTYDTIYTDLKSYNTHKN